MLQIFFKPTLDNFIIWINVSLKVLWNTRIPLKIPEKCFLLMLWYLFAFQQVHGLKVTFHMVSVRWFRDKSPNTLLDAIALVHKSSLPTTELLIKLLLIQHTWFKPGSGILALIAPPKCSTEKTHFVISAAKLMSHTVFQCKLNHFYLLKAG